MLVLMLNNRGGRIIMRKDTIATRNKIIATAERLFSEYGVDAVSLNEITREAEQKNKSALSYHFGSKQGLIKAIIDKHSPAVITARDDYLNRATINSDVPEEVIRAVVYALSAKLDDEEGGRFYLSVLAQLAASNSQSLYELGAEYLSEDDRVWKMGKDFFNEVPEELRMPRLLQATNMLLHSLAYLARILDKEPGVTPLKGHRPIKRVYIDNLVDGLVAITSVSPSVVTQKTLSEAV